MALMQVGESYNMPSKVYYCDTEDEFEANFSDGDSTTPGTKVYILEENKIMIKGDTTWGVLSSGGGSGGSTSTEISWAHSIKEGF